MIMSIKQQIININEKYQRNEHEKSNFRFFDDKINIPNFDPNLLKTYKKQCKNIDFYYIGYITMNDSDYVKSKCVNPLYLIISEVDGHFEEKIEINTQFLILQIKTKKN